MAGWFFELFVHRYLTRTSSKDGFWPPIKMTSDDGDSPQFTKPSGPSSRIAGDVHFAKVERKIIHFQSLPKPLENKTYLIPKTPNFPLFDAFTMDINPSKQSKVLWVLQITTSRLYRCSAEDYQHVRNIIAQLKVQPREGPPPKKEATARQPVDVRYLIIIPKADGSRDLSWRFPKG